MTVSASNTTLFPTQVWRHSKTMKDYNIRCFAVDEATLNPIVVYQEVGGAGAIWSRSCAEFFDGRFQQVQWNVTAGGGGKP